MRGPAHSSGEYGKSGPSGRCAKLGIFLCGVTLALALGGCPHAPRPDGDGASARPSRLAPADAACRVRERASRPHDLDPSLFARALGASRNDEAVRTLEAALHGEARRVLEADVDAYDYPDSGMRLTFEPVFDTLKRIEVFARDEGMLSYVGPLPDGLSMPMARASLAGAVADGGTCTTCRMLATPGMLEVDDCVRSAELRAPDLPPRVEVRELDASQDGAPFPQGIAWSTLVAGRVRGGALVTRVSLLDARGAPVKDVRGNAFVEEHSEGTGDGALAMPTSGYFSFDVMRLPPGDVRFKVVVVARLSAPGREPLEGTREAWVQVSVPRLYKVRVALDGMRLAVKDYDGFCRGGACMSHAQVDPPDVRWTVTSASASASWTSAVSTSFNPRWSRSSDAIWIAEGGSVRVQVVDVDSSTILNPDDDLGRLTLTWQQLSGKAPIHAKFGAIEDVVIRAVLTPK